MLNQNFIRSININSLSKDGYYSKIPALKNLKELKFETPITFFMGENGSGKSTLLEAIAVGLGFNAEGGSIDFNFSTKETHSDLHENIDFVKSISRPKDSFFLRAESYYNVASYLEDVYSSEIWAGYDLDQYGGVPHKKSHGQAFLGLIKNRFRGKGLYILDEPEAALSPQNQLATIAILNELAKDGSQFIIATHSPILSATPNSTIYSFDDEKITKVNYDETSAFEITKMMVQDKERMIKYLLD